MTIPTERMVSRFSVHSEMVKNDQEREGATQENIRRFNEERLRQLIRAAEIINNGIASRDSITHGRKSRWVTFESVSDQIPVGLLDPDNALGLTHGFAEIAIEKRALATWLQASLKRPVKWDEVQVAGASIKFFAGKDDGVDLTVIEERTSPFPQHGAFLNSTDWPVNRIGYLENDVHKLVDFHYGLLLVESALGITPTDSDSELLDQYAELVERYPKTL